MKNDIEKLIILYKKLYDIIVGKDINFKYTVEKYIIEIIELLNVYKINKSLELKNEIVAVYRSLYPPRDGLTEFFFWDNNYEKRMEMNKELDKVKKEISILMEKLFYEEK